MMAQAEKKKAAQARRRSKRSKTRPEAELQVEWTARFRMVLKQTEVPPWGPAERSLAKKMAEELGFDQALVLIRHFLDTWEARRWRKQEQRGDVPSMKLCWHIRQKLLAELEGTVKTPVSKRSRLMSDEYDEESAANSPDEGW